MNLILEFYTYLLLFQKFTKVNNTITTKITIELPQTFISGE